MRPALRTTLAGILFLVTAAVASAHVMQVEDETIDYSKLKGGVEGKTDCCDNQHCRPAVEWEWVEGKKQWRFRVHVHPTNPASELADVFVDDNEVSREDLTRKKSAHWCGNVYKKSDGPGYGWNTRCAFVPAPKAAQHWMPQLAFK